VKVLAKKVVERGEKTFFSLQNSPRVVLSCEQIEVTRICNLAGMENGREREKIGIK